jgi:hypothetical protein
LTFISKERRTNQRGINIPNTPKLGQAFNRRILDIKDEAWEMGFHPSPSSKTILPG